MIEYRTVDKSKWPMQHGPWMNEPDKAQWIAHGLDCLIVRGPHGGLCGYVGIPESHPAFGKGYDDVSVEHAHGGLTFAARCEPNANEEQDICHRHDVAANAVVWWLGFDCAHCTDVSPSYERNNGDRIYRTFEYVKECCENMAQELANRK